MQGGILFHINEDGTGLVADILRAVGWATTQGQTKQYINNSVRYGFEDWYTPSKAELILLYNNVGPGSNMNLSPDSNQYWNFGTVGGDFAYSPYRMYLWASENSYVVRFDTGNEQYVWYDSGNGYGIRVVKGLQDGVEGCTDMSACNYNSDATVDDGSCTNAAENFTCDGIFKPESKAALQTAVDLWVSNNSSALSIYGEINTWDVSLITNMSSLFSWRTTFNDDIIRFIFI